MKKLKALIEKRTELQETLEQIVKTADIETRAMDEKEILEFERIENEIKAIDATIKCEERARNIEKQAVYSEKSNTEIEERAFKNYVLGITSEIRAGEQNVTMSNNGAIIPTTIADRIIKKVKDICPILAKATQYSVKGILKVPVWGDASGHNISVGYQKEFSQITADAGKFTSVDLGGYLVGALTLIGKSVENNGSFDVVTFIVNQMAEEIAAFLEKELLTGTGSSAAQGAINTQTSLTTAAATSITVDELIELQTKVKQAYQSNAYWTMHPDTFTSLKKLKDANGRYLIQDDVSSEFPFRLLGKAVYLSDNMAKVAAGARSVLYGDYSGMSINMRENIYINVLNEKYSDLHAIGVQSWLEFDSKVTDNQKLAVLIQESA